MSLFGSYCYYIFLFFTLKFQIGKKFVFEIWNILYGNYREKLLWFNAFFCQICENLYPQIIWFSNILLIQFSQNFLDCKKLFLRTFFFFSWNIVFKIFQSSHFLDVFLAWYYIFDHSRMFILAENHSRTPLARDISLRFANFSASKSLFQESFYLHDTGC